MRPFLINTNAIEGEYQAGEVDAIERWQRKTESYVHEKCGLTDADLKILQIVISSLLKGVPTALLPYKKDLLTIHEKINNIIEQI